MSGTSLDGLDMAICQFDGLSKSEILQTKTVDYSAAWRERLSTAHLINGLELKQLEIDFTKLILAEVEEIIKSSESKVDFIACHGHTIFHNPAAGLTYQMLDGSMLAATTGITAVCDFRSTDVALGGQGAPLVPVGDAHLFAEYEGCLNIGGFANVSYDEKGVRLAFDISPANIVLNLLAERLGKEYDDKGALAKTGNIDQALLTKLNALPYYRAHPPKSLGREWVEENIIGLLGSESTIDLLRTCVEHIALAIAESLNKHCPKGKVLATGGGVFNEFLMDRIRTQTHASLIIPSAELICFKEALVFAYLGKLRLENAENTLASVTGATKNSSGGAVYL